MGMAHPVKGREGKKQKEKRRKKQICETKNMYSVISFMGMCLCALKFRKIQNSIGFTTYGLNGRTLHVVE